MIAGAGTTVAVAVAVADAVATVAAMYTPALPFTGPHVCECPPCAHPLFCLWYKYLPNHN